MNESDEFRELRGAATDAARRLLGCELERTFDDGARARVRIVETEAYDQTDEGSHTFRGRTERTRAMFGAAGHAYVYFTYGMHYCFNIVAGEDGFGSGVLIRAAEPVEGEDLLEVRRVGVHGVNLTNGPAKLCKAFDIDKRLYGHDLSREPLRLIMRPPVPARDIITTTRVGLSRGVETEWRYYLRGNKYVSKK